MSTSPSPACGTGRSTTCRTSGPPNSSIWIARIGSPEPIGGTLPRAVTVTVVGSIAFDAVRTPFGERDRMLGGSAVHFSLAASFSSDVRVVGTVGDDFGEPEFAVLRERGIDTEDVER